MIECKECGKAFKTERALHCHIKEHDMYMADYYTKHHSTIHHKGVRHRYINDKLFSVVQSFVSDLNPVFTTLRGCIDPHSSLGY